MRVEFAGLLLYTKVSLQLPQYSPLLQNQHFQIRHVQFDLSRTQEGWEGSQQVLGNRDMPSLKDGISLLEEKVNKIRNGNYERDEGFTALLFQRTDLTGKKNQLHYLKCWIKSFHFDLTVNAHIFLRPTMWLFWQCHLCLSIDLPLVLLIQGTLKRL